MSHGKDRQIRAGYISPGSDTPGEHLPQDLQFMNNRELIIDNFAGGGGASSGIAMAIGRSVDIAINHDPLAIAMHRINHPATKHYCESVWDIVPLEVTGGKPVALCWLSPDCTFFSRAKGGKPLDKKIRGLAWIALRWAATARPRVIMLENVPEFQEWGALMKNGRPDPKKRGRTFQTFVNALRKQGYTVDWRELTACDFGAPTSRTRLFLIARRDHQPIVWPEPTHGDQKSPEVGRDGLLPWRPASEVIDWSIGCPSIFGRKKPLAEKTCQRIARGIKRFVLDDPSPFVVEMPWEGEDHPAQSAAFLAKHYGGGYTGPGVSLRLPVSTITSVDHHALVSCRLSDMPDLKGKSEEVNAFLLKYYGTNVGHRCSDPLQTITSKHRFGLVMVHQKEYQIVDIGMRMLKPRELFSAQGFSSDYIIDHSEDNTPISETAQVARCGNAVPPPFAKALVEVNLPELCSGHTRSFSRRTEDAV